ncbi:TPA: hypothetical protein PBR28_004759 [Escherichia coli]|nr:hypothetical protein [Escherichia coli]
MKRKTNQTIDERLQQLREQFQQQTTSPRPETLKRLLVLEPQTLNNIVDTKVGELVEHYTDSEPLALGVQLFVRIARQNPQLPAFVVFDCVLALGNLYSLKDEFAQALEDLQLLN